MKQLLKISEMMPFLPTALKDAIHHVAKDTGNKTDDLELHRHTHSEKAKINEIDPSSRKSLAYVSYRTQDRDDEIVIPKSLKLDEFRKYSSVLVNHNYSLLPVGSDEWIDADDFGIKALTVHADTGAGTMANVVWDLVRQGHLKGRSVGFVPTSYTKPGARDWDHVANQLQSNWKEFDKGRAEKSVSRIITGGVLLEHSFVSVPCNTDAELIGVVKSMNLDGKIIKQLGLEDKPAEKVPSVCDECGYVADAVPGSKCPECKTGDMKPKGREKAIEVRVVSKGDIPGHEFHGNQYTGGGGSGGKGDDGGKDAAESLARNSSDKKLLDILLNRSGRNDAPDVIAAAKNEAVRRGLKVDSGDEGEDGHRAGSDDMKPKGREKAIEVRVVSKGGPGSGNFGHEGRPGEVGGSGPGDPRFAKDYQEGYGGTKVSSEVLKPAVEFAKAQVSFGNKYVDTMENQFHISTGLALHIADMIKEERRSRSGSSQSMADARIDRILRIRDSSGRATARKSLSDGMSIFGKKGGPGSGSWEGPGDPRFAKEGGSSDGANDKPEDEKYNTGSQRARDGNYGVGDRVKVTGNVSGAGKTVVVVGFDKDGSYATVRSGGKYQSYHNSDLTKKSFEPEIKVVRPAPSVKVLYVPPDAELIVKGVSTAIEHALARRTGKIM